MSLQKRLQRARSGDFVGREAQLDLFKRNISARIPEYPFLQIVGQGGVGKTTLLRRFRALCDEQRVLHTLTDDIEKTAPSAMRRLAELLEKAGHPLKSFAERYQTYLQLQEKIQKEPDQPDFLSLLFSRATSKSTTGLPAPGKWPQRYNVKKIRTLLMEGFTPEELRRLCYDLPNFKPVYEELAEGTGKGEIVDRLLEHAERKLQFEQLLRLAQTDNPARYAEHAPYIEAVTRPLHPAGPIGLDDSEGSARGGLRSYLFQKLNHQEEVQLLLEPEVELTSLFIADLNEVAHDRQVVLMFDTFEDTGPVLLPWLLKLAEGCYGEVSEYLSFVCAGRSFDAHAWLPLQPLLEHYNLESFSQQETKIYLETHGVTDSVAIEQIYHLSGGLPVFVAMLAAPDTASAGQATRSVVERFLRNIEDPLRRQIALDLALTRRFDKDVLVSLLPAANSQAADELFAWLISMPFVQARRDYWVYHAVVRTQMVAYQRGQSRSEFERLHQTLADYYHEQADKRGRQAAAKWQDRAWWPYHLEATYHGLCAKPSDQVTATKIELAELLARWDEAILAWSEALNQAATDLVDHEAVSQWARLVKPGLEATSANDMGNAFKLFDTLCRLPTAAELPIIGAIMYFGRALGHAALGKQEEALADYAEAIRLNPTYASAFYNRGTTYDDLNRFEEALADYAEAIRLNPTYASAFYNLACAHALQDNLTAVLSALRRALELDPADHLALIPTDSDFDLVRNAPGFQALLVEFSAGLLTHSTSSGQAADN